MTHTHTYATLAVSQSAFDEIRDKLKAAESTDGFEYHKHDDAPFLMDMSGIALVVEADD
jgi:hypothetical protein